MPFLGLSRRAALLAALVLPLAACGSTPPRLYTLAAVPGPTASGPTDIALRTVGVPRYLDKPQIVRYSSAYELQASESERWGEPFGNMVSRVLAENLSQRLPGSNVYPAGGVVSGPAPTVIEVEIARFDIQPDGSVVLAAQWAVRPSSERVAPYVRSGLFREQAASAQTGEEVLAMSRALGQLSDQIASQLPLSN